MNDFKGKRWFTVKEVCDVTGQTQDVVALACRNDEIKGAYRARHAGGSPWKIPAQGAQDWFDVIRGIKRLSDKEMALPVSA